MATIKDSVHDHIEVEGVAAALLDTEPVQRLRHVKQLGTVHLVYPSANHTRFEHSLGVHHLADRALNHLGVDGVQAERVRAAALLHDVGHSPYSHNVEPVIQRHTGKYHDDVHGILASGAVGDVLRGHDLDPGAVADLVAGDGQYGQLVSGELDVDRMDYLVRDAHHTGVPYGTIDHGRLVRELRYRDGRLVLADGNVQTAESLLLARVLMNGTVYRHHVSRIAGAMLERASERLLDADGPASETTEPRDGAGTRGVDHPGDVDVHRFRRLADHDLLIALRGVVPDLARRIERRDLYKRAVWAPLDAVPAEIVELTHGEARAAAAEIADRAGVDPDSVLVDVPPRPQFTESRSRVVVDGAVRRLSDASELVGALRDVERAQWRLGVYAPAGAVDAVGDAAAAVLGLAGDGRPEAFDA